MTQAEENLFHLEKRTAFMLEILPKAVSPTPWPDKVIPDVIKTILQCGDPEWNPREGHCRTLKQLAIGCARYGRVVLQ